MGILSWESMGTFCLLEAASSGHLRNYSFFPLNVFGSFFSSKGCCVILAQLKLSTVLTQVHRNLPAKFKIDVTNS